MRDFLEISKASVLSSLRNGGEVFWELIFPLIVLVVFNFVSFESPILRVYTSGLDLPDDGYEVVKSPELADVEVKLVGEKLIVVIRTPDEIKRAMVESLVWKIKSHLERKDIERSVVVKSEILGREYNVKGYILGGILVMMILSSGMFTTVRVLSLYEHGGLLKLFRTTPVRRPVLYAALSVSGPIVAVIGTAAALAFSKLSGISYEIRIPTFAFAFVFGISVSMALGALISIVFKSPRGAQGFASLLYTLMPFLSGVYFPVEFLPKSIRWVAFLMPTKYMVDLVRAGLGM